MTAMSSQRAARFGMVWWDVHLLNVVHHDVLDLVHLLLQTRHLGQLLRMLHAVVHVVLQPRPATNSELVLDCIHK